MLNKTKMFEATDPINVKDQLIETPPAIEPTVKTDVTKPKTNDLKLAGANGETFIPEGSNQAIIANAKKDANQDILLLNNDGEDIVSSADPEEWQAGTADYKDEAQKQADLKFAQDLESVKESQINARKNVEKNTSESAQSFEMLKYANNQTIEKMGWTGGSYTDLKSMEQYIKATIAADMYGQIELLKYGYKTELAKAVAAKEANLAALEYEFFQRAFQNNLALSEQTGVWIHPLIENDLAQLDIAESIMSDLEAKPSDTWTTDERASYERAQGIVGSISEWYMNSENPLTLEGITALKEYFKEQNYYNDVTLTALQMEDLQITTENAERLANQSYSESEFEAGRVVDAEGNLVVDLNSNNYEAISSYFEENPGQWNEWVLNKFAIPIQAAFGNFRKENPSDTTITTLQAYLAANPNLLDDVVDYATKTGMDKFTIGDRVYHIKDGKIVNPGTGPVIPEDVPRVVTAEEAGVNINEILPGDEIKVGGYTYIVDDDRKIVLQEDEGSISIDTYYDNIIKDEYKDYFKNTDYEFSTTETGMTFTTSNSNDFRSFIGSFKDGDGAQGEQVPYADSIINAANNNLIPEGSLVKFNYGKTDDEAGYAIYQNGKFYKLTFTMAGKIMNDTMGEFNIWVPSGYKVDGSGKVTKK